MSIDQKNRAARAPAARWLIASCMLAAAAAHAQSEVCGELANGFGPFDYNDPLATVVSQRGGETPLHLVERAHFTSDVEHLIRGASMYDPVGDIDYTLRAFPNHPRALHAMGQYYLRHPEKGPKLGQYTIDCWFERALRFAPRDGVVREVYGIFLQKKGDREGALEQFKTAIDLVPNFAEAHYNLGLLYVDLKRFDLANEHAQQAYSLGFPLPGLRKRLQDLGAWKPIATGAVSPATPPVAAR